jgi:hypothetical protein
LTYAEHVQATVHRFDPTTSSGSVVTDAGVVLPFATAVFEASPLRMLRQGQRLTVTVVGSGTHAKVTGLALGLVGVVPTRPSRP